MTKFAIVVAIVLVVAALVFARVARGQSLPSFAPRDAADETRVAKFVDAFLRNDSQARQLLNASNVLLFSEGYRPRVGVPHNPETAGNKIGTLQAYFSRKIYLDLHALEPFSEPTFRKFVDDIGDGSEETIMCAGDLSVKYRLNVEGRFVFENEVEKIPAGAERKQFKQCWLNDAILGTELRMLAWIYGELFGQPYVSPGSRRSA